MSSKRVRSRCPFVRQFIQRSVMKRLPFATLVLLIAANMPVHAQDLTRAEVRNQLVEASKAGYDSAYMNGYRFPADIQDSPSSVAQDRDIARTSVGGANSGSTQAGAGAVR
jgi:hypothetical protein